MHLLVFADECDSAFFRMLDIAKAMRLKISKKKGLSGLGADEDHKFGTLSLPLPSFKPSGGQRKRKKMD